MTPLAVTITRKAMAELLPKKPLTSLGPEEVRGQTLVSLVSPGTELAGNYLGRYGEFPNSPGYAAIFIAEEIGSNVEGVKVGEQLFCMGKHQSIQQHPANTLISISDKLAPEEAVLARLMGVTMTTLRTTVARPGDVILIMGAGPVGYLCAHLFKGSGYDVLVVDPNSDRCKIAKESGLRNVFSSVPEVDDIKGSVAMVIDCSGHEQAVLDGARAVRKGGEVVLVGAPWKQYTDLTAHELLNVIFHNFCILRSGLEWELPLHTSDFRPHSIYSGFRLALHLLAEKRIPCQDLITLHKPQNAQDVYQGLLHGKMDGLFQVFDWQNQNTPN